MCVGSQTHQAAHTLTKEAVGAIEALHEIHTTLSGAGTIISRTYECAKLERVLGWQGAHRRKKIQEIQYLSDCSVLLLNFVVLLVDSSQQVCILCCQLGFGCREKATKDVFAILCQIRKSVRRSGFQAVRST